MAIETTWSPGRVLDEWRKLAIGLWHRPDRPTALHELAEHIVGKKEPIVEMFGLLGDMQRGMYAHQIRSLMETPGLREELTKLDGQFENDLAVRCGLEPFVGPTTSRSQNRGSSPEFG